MTLNVANSTIYGNKALGGNAGAIFADDVTPTQPITSNYPVQIRVSNSTVAANSAASVGAFLNGDDPYTYGFNVIFYVGGTIVAGNVQTNQGPAEFTFPDVYGIFTSENYNLIGNARGGVNPFNNTCYGFYVNSRCANTAYNKYGGDTPLDAKLDALADNGGQTPTVALLPGSPAFDGGAATAADQRGAARPIDDPLIANAANGSDIGAFEADPLSGSIGGSIPTTLTVNSTGDTDDGTCGINHCSLREAINASNNLAGDQTINIGATGTINLSNRLPEVTSSVVIKGSGKNSLTVSGANSFTVFQITQAVNVSISGLTVANGSSNVGGGIVNASGTLGLSDCAFKDNFAEDAGGALWSYQNSATTINNCSFTNNTATNSGGGAIYYGGSLTVNNSTFSGNKTINGSGGAIRILPSGSGVFADNSFTNNFAAAGGAIASDGSLTVSRSTFSTNTAMNDGGALYITGGTLSLINSTVSGNNAANGGGIFQSGGALNLNHDTLTRNSAATGGGIGKSGGAANISNTIVAANTATTSDADASGAFTSGGFNLIGATSGNGFSAATDLTGTTANPLNAKLDLTLKNNGGATLTHALLFDSPAIDAGSGTNEDQRGRARPNDLASVQNAAGGDGADIGALEMDFAQSGQSFVVNTNEDVDRGSCGVGHCSLREAINAANASFTSDGDAVNAITFAPDIREINVASALPVIRANVTITGSGADALKIRAAAQGFRIFETSGNATLEKLSIENAYLPGSTVSVSTSGAAISNSGTLVLKNVNFSNNRAVGGGAIYNTNSLTAQNGAFTGNNANRGGAIYNEAAATIENSVFTDNAASVGTGVRVGGAINSAGTGSNLNLSGGSFSGNTAAFGGALYVVNGGANINGGKFTGNTAERGGALYFGSGNTAARKVENSTVSGNNARRGGGIYSELTNASAVLEIVSSTISGNTAIVPATPTGLDGQGGGILVGSGALKLTSSTVAANNAATSGGGIAVAFAGNFANIQPSAQIRNTISAKNTVANGGTAPDCFGTITSNGYNLFGDISGCTVGGAATGDITNVDPLLDSLGDYGGATETHRLKAGSPAIDAGDNANAPATDQRGLARVVDGNGDGTATIDIGAIEMPLTVATTAINSQPQNQTVCDSAAANFSVGATGTSLAYQWRKGGVNLTNGATISGATSANLTINSAASSDAGSYDVVISGAGGTTATSNAATLTVSAAPTVTGQPSDQTINPGANASFTASADRAESVKWQISTDGGANFSDISGANSATLTLNAVTLEQNGNKYRAVFAGACGNPATTNAATLNVARLAQTITFDAIADKTYGDAPFALAASASSNLPVNFSVVSGAATVSGNALTINGAGAITVRAAQAGNNQYAAAPSVERTFNVAKAQASITLTNLSQPYNGTPKTAIVSGTTPSNLNVALAYSQHGTSVAQPTNAGSYAVSATINDANYQGSANATLTIAKATPEIVWNNPADIAYGSKLGAAQLNATASTAGSFVYNPATDTLLNGGRIRICRRLLRPTMRTIMKR